MKIREIRTLSGPNYWTRRPCIQLVLDIGELEERPTNKIRGFYGRLKKALPSLYDHRCSIGSKGGFFQRVKKGTWMGHVAEHVALELQTLAEMETGFGRTRETSERGVYNVIYSYVVGEAGKRAGILAVELCENLVEKKDFDIEAAVQELKELREKYKLGPSTGSIVAEAVRRGIPYIRLNRGSFVQLGYGNRQRKIRATMTDRTASIAVDYAADKWETKKILEDHGIPVPRGIVTRKFEDAKKSIRKIEYPLVVKPLDGNHGRGVTVGVNDLEHFATAFDAAKLQSRKGWVIIEKTLAGNDYRVLVINGKMVAVAHRVPAHVIGNGKDTLQALIDRENENPLRGYGHENVLTEITVDHQTERLIEDAGYTLKSVLPKGEMLTLKTTANLSTGGTAMDITDEVHPANVHIAERAIRLIGLDIGGVDIIAPDLTTPLNENGGGIVEINAAPGFRMHLQPTSGLARNVAEPVIDMLFPPGVRSTIPIVAVTGTNGKTTTTRLISHILKGAGSTVGMCTTEGVYIKNRLVYPGDMTGPKSHGLVLSDPTIDAAVLECARGGILRAGLGYRECNVGVVTNISPDHLGLKGIDTLKQLARVKSVIPQIVRKDGHAILNADDPLVARMERYVSGETIYYSLDPRNEIIRDHKKNNGISVVLEGEQVCIYKGPWKYPLLPLADIPITFDGKAAFNIMNTLAAVGATFALGISDENIKAGISTFFPSYSQTPGRTTLEDMLTFKVLIDYAHNQAGYQALKDFALALPAERRIVTVSLPGDRREV
ncbi:MAG: cyanophycin synthetase, partial [Methanobacteriota archaeon]